MKKKIILGFIILSAISCKAQTIVPIEKMGNYIDAGEGIPNNTYLKDVNNLLPKYVGTWKGVYNGKNYTLYITKITSKYETILTDELLIRHLITSSNGTILEDTRSLPDANVTFDGSYFNKDLTSYALDFSGENTECGNSGTVFIRIKNTAKTLMSLSFEPDGDIIMISKNNCPGGKLAEFTFPKDNVMMLTKQ